LRKNVLAATRVAVQSPKPKVLDVVQIPRIPVRPVVNFLIKISAYICIGADFLF